MLLSDFLFISTICGPHRGCKTIYHVLFPKIEFGVLNDKLIGAIKLRVNSVKRFSRTDWIDRCPTDGNMLASCGFDRNVKIFDRRQKGIVMIFSEVTNGNNLWITR